MKDNYKNELFIPLYINKTRLLDIISILFDGYSEFSEVEMQSGEKNNNSTNGKIKANVGMSIFSLGSSVEGNSSADNTSSSKIVLKKYQTSSSLLANTINMLKNRNLLKNDEMKIGSFIEIIDTFKNNSILDFLNQLLEVINLSKLSSKISDKKSDNSQNNALNNTIKQIEEIKKLLTSKTYNYCELVADSDNNIFVIKVDPSFIYNCYLEDIYNNELCVFGQIKGIYDDYNFFSDTPFSKLDSSVLSEFINQLKLMTKINDYKFNFEGFTNSEGKKVIEIDLIAIYRKCESIG